MYKGYKALTSLLCENKKNDKFKISCAHITEDNSKDEFANWLILQIQQHVTFLFSIFFASAIAMAPLPVPISRIVTEDLSVLATL